MGEPDTKYKESLSKKRVGKLTTNSCKYMGEYY